MKDFVLRNASEEEWQDMINSLEVRETTSETLVGEPVIKEKYFEFQTIDDTSYRVPATIEEQLLTTVWIFAFNSIVCCAFHDILSNAEEKNKQKVESQKVKSINKN